MPTLDSLLTLHQDLQKEVQVLQVQLAGKEYELNAVAECIQAVKAMDAKGERIFALKPKSKHLGQGKKELSLPLTGRSLLDALHDALEMYEELTIPQILDKLVAFEKLPKAVLLDKRSRNIMISRIRATVRRRGSKMEEVSYANEHKREHGIRLLSKEAPSSLESTTG